MWNGLLREPERATIRAHHGKSIGVRHGWAAVATFRMPGRFRPRALTTTFLMVTLLGGPWSGCVTDAAEPSAGTMRPPPAGAVDIDVGSNRSLPVVAPDLVPGTAWTYRQNNLYDAEDEITVVVATAGPSGYLFAGASEADLSGEIVWGRVWFGERDRNLALVPRDKDPGGWNGLDFPLHDGKSWEMARGTVTARAGPVASPEGLVDGFVISRDVEDGEVFWEYAPSIGFVTRYVSRIGGVTYTDMTLTRMAHSSTYTWYEGAEWSESFADPADAKTRDLPGSYDAVVVSAGCAFGGQVALTPPAGSGMEPWRFTCDGPEEWASGTLPAAAGNWGLASSVLHDPGNAFAGVWMRPVTWIEGRT